MGSVYAPDAIAFLIHALNHKGELIYPQLSESGIEQPAITPSREAVERGIQTYLHEKTEYTAEVSVSIELESVHHPDEFVEQFEETE
jgi:hypothetical protein